MKDYVLLAQQIRKYRKREGLTRNGFCEMVGLNFTSYAHIEPTDNKPIPDRPIGLKIYKLLVKYFLYVGDTDMILALLGYAALDPRALQLMLVADAWVKVEDGLPEAYRAVNVSCVDKEGEFVAEGYYNALSPAVWVLRDSIWVNEVSGIKVIAWQPLPEPMLAAGVAEVEAGEVTK